MAYRKFVSVRDFMEREGLGKKLTRKKQGLVHARLRGAGLVCSAPVSAPAHLPTVWLHHSDPRTALMSKAAARTVVAVDELNVVRPLWGSRYRTVAALGIAAVPAGDGQLRLVGTSPQLAAIVNQYYHGRRRRWLHRRELIDVVFGINSNGRRTVVTERRLEYALCYVNDEYGCDLSDLIDHEELLIGCGSASC